MLLFRNRIFKDYWATVWMWVCLVLVILLPFLLTSGLYWKSSLIFQKNSLGELLFSGNWQPLGGKFGFKPFIISSVWVSLIALAISGPICLLTAIFLTQYARKWVLKFMHPVVDILAGIPSVVYGVWGILVIVPFIEKYLAPFFHYDTNGYSILAGAIVLAVMIVPFILNINIDILKSIPHELKEASLSLGATEWQTIKRVLLKKAFPGIISSFGLGLSRAFGETIAVLMVVGNVVKIPKNVFDAGYPLPALIANNYGEMMSIPMYDSALMLAAFILLFIVLFFNFITRVLIHQTEKSSK